MEKKKSSPYVPSVFVHSAASPPIMKNPAKMRLSTRYTTNSERIIRGSGMRNSSWYKSRRRAFCARSSGSVVTERTLRRALFCRPAAKKLPWIEPVLSADTCSERTLSARSSAGREDAEEGALDLPRDRRRLPTCKETVEEMPPAPLVRGRLLLPPRDDVELLPAASARPLPSPSADAPSRRSHVQRPSAPRCGGDAIAQSGAVVCGPSLPSLNSPAGLPQAALAVLHPSASGGLGPPPRTAGGARGVARRPPPPPPPGARGLGPPPLARACGSQPRARGVAPRPASRLFLLLCCCVAVFAACPLARFPVFVCLFVSFRLDWAARHACVFARRARACVLMAAPRRARARASLDVVCFARAALGRGRGAPHTARARAAAGGCAIVPRGGGGRAGAMTSAASFAARGATPAVRSPASVLWSCFVLAVLPQVLPTAAAGSVQTAPAAGAGSVPSVEAVGDAAVTLSRDVQWDLVVSSAKLVLDHLDMHSCPSVYDLAISTTEVAHGTNNDHIFASYEIEMVRSAQQAEPRLGVTVNISATVMRDSAGEFSECMSDSIPLDVDVNDMSFAPAERDAPTSSPSAHELVTDYFPTASPLRSWEESAPKPMPAEDDGGTFFNPPADASLVAPAAHAPKDTALLAPAPGPAPATPPSATAMQSPSPVGVEHSNGEESRDEVSSATSLKPTLSPTAYIEMIAGLLSASPAREAVVTASPTSSVTPQRPDDELRWGNNPAAITRSPGRT